MAFKNIVLFEFFILLLVGIAYQQSSSSNNIAFDVVDLTIDYQKDNEFVTLEAYRSLSNDAIIMTKDNKSYGQLIWLSIGNPKLVLTYNLQTNKSELFNFKPEGFTISIEMLTNEYRNLFKDIVKRKYNIDVKPEQIVSLIPSKFECQIMFYQEDSKILINGKVSQLNSFPLKLIFTAPAKSAERLAFEQRLKQDGAFFDIDISCDIYSQGTLLKQNTLIITGNQINQLGLADELFGTGQETYVTRNQLSTLSSYLYQSLNVLEDYQIPETQFKESFITDFLSLTASQIFKYTSIDTVLSSLSHYDISQDLQPNIIKQEMSRVFYINKTGSKELLVLNKTQYERLTQNSGKSGSAGFAGISFGGSASYASSHQSDWEKLGITFSDQLSELNNYNENEVEWSRVGNIVQPKSLKVSKIGRAAFSSDLKFSRVKRVFYDAPFRKTIFLNTLSKLTVPDTIVENTKRIKSLEDESVKLSSFFKSLDLKQNVTFSSVDGKIAKIAERIEEIKNTVNNNQNSINNLNNLNNQLSTKINSKLNSCRICFRETEGSSQCQGTRYSCSPYASVTSNSPGWTAGFRDDTDNRNGGCTYSWIIECN